MDVRTTLSSHNLDFDILLRGVNAQDFLEPLDLFVKTDPGHSMEVQDTCSDEMQQVRSAPSIYT
jgi:hypothetical protein